MRLIAAITAASMLGACVMSEKDFERAEGERPPGQHELDEIAGRACDETFNSDEIRECRQRI